MRSQNRDEIALRFYLNMVDGVIHDLENEKDQCKIAEVRVGGCGVGFVRLETALSAGFVPCRFCLEQKNEG